MSSTYDKAARGLAGVFDEDEENPPVGFEQDPDEDEIGVGTWRYADGTTRYSKGDAEEAKTLMKAPKAAEPANDRQTLEMPNSKPLSEEEKARLAPPADDLQKLSDQLDGNPRKPAPAPAEATETPKPLQPLRAPGLPGASGPARYNDSAQAQRSASRSDNTSSSESTNRSAMSQEAFDRQQSETAKGYEGAMQSAVGGAFQEAGAIRQRAEQLAQMGRDREAAASGAMAQRDERANYVKQKIQEVGSRKTDMNGLWKEKGALGTTLGLLGVALRSLNATKFGGPNTAMQSLQEQRKQNLQAQMEDRDSELRGLERELGSLDAAVPILEARMRDAEAKRLEAMMATEKSQGVLANGSKLVSQLRLERDAKLAEAEKAYFGTVAKQQASSQAQSVSTGETVGRDRMSGAGVGETKGGKSGAELYDDMLERDKKMEERGATMEQRQAMWDAVGLKMPSGESAPARTNREQEEKVKRDEATLTEDQAKAEAALDSLLAYGDDAGLTRDKNDDFEDPGFIAGSVKPGWAEPVTEALGRPTPVKDSRKVASQAVGRLVSGGVIGKEEGEDLLQMIGDENASRAQVASRLNRVKRLVHTRRKANRREEPTGPRGKPINPEATSE